MRFGLTDEQKKLTGKARIDVLQKLADQANDFTEALQVKGADFDQVVAKFQLTPKETADFSKASPDPALASAPELVQAAFALTKEAPNSDAIQTPDGFDVLTLLKVEPSRPLTLEEARSKIVEALKQQRAQQMVAMKASEVARKLRDELKSGKPVGGRRRRGGREGGEDSDFCPCRYVARRDALAHTRSEKREARHAPHQASRERLESR